MPDPEPELGFGELPEPLLDVLPYGPPPLDELWPVPEVAAPFVVPADDPDGAPEELPCVEGWLPVVPDCARLEPPEDEPPPLMALPPPLELPALTPPEFAPPELDADPPEPPT